MANDVEHLPNVEAAGSRDENSISSGVEALNAIEGQRIMLPRRPGESRFAPPQYYYVSKSGAVPSWAVSSMQK
jgi:hypothetical protein